MDNVPRARVRLGPTPNPDQMEDPDVMNPQTADPEIELDEDILDELPEFEGRDLDRAAATDHDYIDRMWQRYGYDDELTDPVQKAIIAQGMVDSMLNAFARDRRYHVILDDAINTAGTDMDRARVRVTIAPLLDPNLTAIEAARIMTGLGVHEISHPRYGGATHRAVRAVFPRSPLAWRISGILDDVRIERRFVGEYPGFSGIFDPVLDYVGQNLVRRNNGRLLVPSLDDLGNFCSGALRYEKFLDWSDPEHAAERDWWQAWARRASREDSPKRHVEFVRDALRHIAGVKARRDAEREQARREAEEAAAAEQEEEAASAAREPDPTPDDDGLSTTEESSEDRDEDGDDPGSDDAPGEGESTAGDEEDGDLEPGDGEGEDDDEQLDPVDLEDADPSDATDPIEDFLDEDDDEVEDLPIDAEGAGTDADSDIGDDADGEPDDFEDLSDEELSDAADQGQGDPYSPTGDLPECAGNSSVDQAAEGAGVDRREIRDTAKDAQQEIDQEEFIESDGFGSKVDVARSLKGLIHGEIAYRDSTRFTKSDVAARYIRDALLRSRTGHTNTSHYQKRGRIDQSALHRITTQDYRLFDKKRAQSPGKFLIWMLLDRSSSMDGNPSIESAQVATAIADATKHVKTVRAAVWAWSWAFRPNRDWHPGVALAWRTGMPTSEIKKTADLSSGGTPDATILGWASIAIRKEARSGETPVIILCSDGYGEDQLADRVADARRLGVEVINVALGGMISEKEQIERFGRDGYVTWQGDIISTSRPLARMIARLVGKDRR